MSWQFCAGCGQDFNTGVNHALCLDCRERFSHPADAEALDNSGMNCLYCATIKRQYP